MFNHKNIQNKNMKNLRQVKATALTRLKTNLKMKLSVLFLVSVLFQVHANSSYAQKTKISLNLSDVPIEVVLDEIQKQSEFRFLANVSEINLSDKVSVFANKKTIKKILTDLFRNRGVNFEVSKKQIILTPKAIDSEDSKDLDIQQTIDGNVKDEDGTPLAGVNILVQGTDRGTQTDFDGKYSITASKGDILRYSYVGYKTQDVTVNDDTTINVTMQEDVSSLDEVVLVAYGSQKKASLTSAVTSVKAEELESIPTSQLSNSIAGRLPGAQIVQNSGFVGSNSSITVRGSNNAALYVIDNIVSNKSQFDALDPNEVDAITILKDAAAAAIYGARASGGVVLITTKKGKSGKTQFKYSNIYTFNRLTRDLQDYTAEEEVIYRNNVALSRWITQGNTVNTFSAPFGDDVLALARTVDYPSVNDEIWRNPTSQQHTLSVSGGSDKINYFFSTGLNESKGSYDNVDFNRYNFRSKVEAKITDNITLTTNISGNRRVGRRFFWPFDGADDQVLSDFFRASFNLSRFFPFYSQLDGTPARRTDPGAVAVVQPGWGFSPAQNIYSGANRKRFDDTFNAIISMDIDIPKVKGLSASLLANFRYDGFNRKNFIVHNSSFEGTNRWRRWSR